MRLVDHFVFASRMTDLGENLRHGRKMVKVHFVLVVSELKKTGSEDPGILDLDVTGND